jgi:ATP-binding cassette subfamily F protein uup
VARAARLEAERKTESARLNLLRRETAWMRRGPPARTTKAKARIHRYEELAGSAPVPLAAELELEIPPGPRLGARVAKLAGVSKRYGERVVVPPLDLELEAGTRLGIVGPNGVGKTTLLSILLGELAPDSGTREVGETVRFMGIDQARRELDPNATVIESLAGKSGVVATGGRTVRVEGFLDKLGFPAKSRSARVSQLSGGEKSRLLLARLLCAGGNVLALDEPTNDLDLATLRALEEAIVAFPGAVVVVSHDRWFLDRVATRILHLDGKGGARLHYGDFSSLLEELASEEREAEKPRAAKAPPKPVAPAKKKGLAPWEQRELDALEAEIPTLEAGLAAVDAELADPALYTRAEARRREVFDRRAKLGAELAALYSRWEELESKRA